MDKQENIPSKTVDKKKYFLFVLINFITVSGILIATGLLSINYFLMSLITLIIISIQYPFLYKYKKRWAWVFIFYVSFLVFCFALNIVLAIKMGGRIEDIDSFLGILLRGVFFTLAGHIYGFIYFPIILGLNWGIREKLFSFK